MGRGKRGECRVLAELDVVRSQPAERIFVDGHEEQLASELWGVGLTGNPRSAQWNEIPQSLVT